MLTMNEKDKNEMLEAILKENEAYQCKLWAVIMEIGRASCRERV